MRRIYFDNAATTRVIEEVFDAMRPCFTENFGNASSLHSFGRDAKELLEASRRKIASCLNADPEEIYFTSGGSESDSLAIIGFCEANFKPNSHIITSSIEHPAVLKAFEHLQKKRGFEVTYLPVDSYGIVDPETFRKAIRKNTIFASIMHSNNVIGTLQPIRELAQIAREADIAFHTDAVQSFGSVPIDVKELGVDMLSISAHKLHGPKGVGALYVAKGIAFDPIIHGGEHERGKRAGTENVAGVVGFAKAAEIAHRDMREKSERLTALREKCVKGVLESIPDVRYNGHPVKRLPGNANFCFKYVEGESIVLYLDMEGIATSSGSACASHLQEPSHVLLAIGLSAEEARGSLRVSLGRENTEDEVEYFLEVLPPIIEKLRRMSPLYHHAFNRQAG